MLFRTIVLPTVVLYTLSFLSVEAQIVKPILEHGISIQALRYNSNEDVLYFSDVEKKTINRYDPVTHINQVLQLDQRATFVIPVRDTPYTFLASMDRDVVVLNWDYGSLSSFKGVTTTYFTCVLVTVDGFCHGNRWNTGEVDGYGNLWAGTLTILDPPDCVRCPPNLYRGLTSRLGLLTADVAIQSFYSNGIEFTDDYRVMYTIDYYNRQVYSFNFNLPSSIISCPKVIFRYDDFNLTGSPDSITKDYKGNLWIGSYGGSQVIQINPNTGELLQCVDIPACLVTSVAFGGKDLDILFVGTAQSDTPEQDPLGGSLFAVTDLGTYGVAEAEAVINKFCKHDCFQ